MPAVSPLLRAAAESLCTVPTAPFCEHHVLAALRPQLAALPHVSVKEDRFGNLMARYRRGKSAPALCLVAHLDHPGFGINKRKGKATPHLLGGVREACLLGQTIEFFGPAGTEPLGEATITGTRWTKTYKWAETDKPVPRGAAFAMWKLHPGAFRGRRWVGRVCDDLANVATMTALLQKLEAEQANADVWCLYTRAEEVGFLGALASQDSGILPPKSVPIISLETSQARGFAKIGAGPILRVGDKSSIFDPNVSAWLADAAKEAGADIQRLLMAGGTCEATAFMPSGRPAGGLCLALHNYHNMTTRGGIGAEAVDASDWQQLVDLLYALSQMKRKATDESSITKTLVELKKRAVKMLPKSVKKPRTSFET